MSQTSYLQNIVAAFAGMLADLGPNGTRSAVNKEAVALPFGIGLKQHTSSDDAVKMPAASTDKVIGVAMFDQSQNNIGLSTSAVPGASILAGERLTMLQRGKIWVLPEEAVSAGDPAFCRFATGTGTQLGAFRKSYDGVAAVVTATPTPANSTLYVLRVAVGGKSFVFETVSSGAATATTICNSLRAAMAADAEFTALVVASGAATLILTGQVTGAPMVVTSEGDGTIGVVNTTPPAATCNPVKGARFETSALANTPAILSFDFLAANT